MPHRFRLTRLTRLRRTPDSQAQGELLTFTSVLEEQEAEAPPEWMVAKVVAGAGFGGTGFVLRDALEPDSPPSPDPAIDPEAFLHQVSFAARRLGGSRDYLFAVAVMESGLRNIKAEGSDAFGPFQFLPSTWRELVRDHPAEGLTEADIADPGAQATGAGLFTLANLKAATDKLGRVPSLAELYLLHLLGRTGGIQALQGALDAPIQASESAITANAKLLRQPGGAPHTLRAVLDKVVERMAPGLAMVARLAATLDPTATAPIMPAPGAAPDDPPWLVKAMQERGIKENPAVGRTNPEVDKYFTATSSPRLNDDSAWCAAFVAWCVQNCGDAAVAATNLQAVRASAWGTWAKLADPPRRGTLLLTVPLDPQGETSGHVGFVLGADAGAVQFVSGNWSNSVAIGTIERSKVVAFRDPRGPAA